MTDAPIIELRRYPSRKLYNKNASSYVRLPEVAEMIRAGANIRVEDTETGEDVTRAVLLQIIMEQESHGEQGVLSVDLMMDMVRLSQSKASEMMTGLFEQSVAFMRSQQEQLASSMTAGMAGMPAMGAMPAMGNMFDPAQMQEMQRQYAARLAQLWPGTMGAMPGMPPIPGMPVASAKPAQSPANDAAEIKALKERLEELERKMSKK